MTFARNIALCIALIGSAASFNNDTVNVNDPTADRAVSVEKMTEAELGANKIENPILSTNKLENPILSVNKLENPILSPLDF